MKRVLFGLTLFLGALSSSAYGQTEPPVGSIVAWHRDFTNTPALPATGEWVECNGQTLSDAASPYDGQTIPDLNDFVNQGLAGYYLRGTADTSGSTQTATVGGHTHTASVSPNPHDHTTRAFTTGAAVVNTPSVTTRSGTLTNLFPNVTGTSLSVSVADNNPSGENRPKTFKVVWIMRVK